MRSRIYLSFSLFLIIFWGCNNPKSHFSEDGQLIHNAQNKLTDIITADIFSPPVASRIYAYSFLAEYEAMKYKEKGTSSITDHLKGFPKMPSPDRHEKINFDLASFHAFCEVAKKMVFSTDSIEQYEQKTEANFQENSDSVKQNSIEFGGKIASAILKRAGEDMYKETRGYPRLTVRKNPEYWKPTQPEYMDAVEPYFAKLKPFLMDSASQFRAAGPYTYSMQKNSPYYMEVMQVYHVVASATPEQRAIANFWDCNPYTAHHNGHLMYATKKITPGGHWMGIAEIACKQKGLNDVESARIYAWLSVTLFDSFISCWEEKYRSLTVRPETVINDLIDPNWRPILQTPPFPDYISGHSVLSAAADTVLSCLVGSNFAYRDTVEKRFGLPPRSFKSFDAAAQEAMISRLYGGIHYMKACKDGFKQGKEIGGIFVTEIMKAK